MQNCKSKKTAGSRWKDLARCCCIIEDDAVFGWLDVRVADNVLYAVKQPPKAKKESGFTHCVM